MSINRINGNKERKLNNIISFYLQISIKGTTSEEWRELLWTCIHNDLEHTKHKRSYRSAVTTWFTSTIHYNNVNDKIGWIVCADYGLQNMKKKNPGVVLFDLTVKSQCETFNGISNVI